MMLLDTHALLWAFGDDDRLSLRARQAIMRDGDLCVSVASLWEMAIKASLPREERRLALDRTIPEFEALCEAHGVRVLPITSEDCERTRALPHIHEDPFDRMIVAQALVRNMPIVTKDENIQKYEEVTTIW